ncbi:MAG TPA: GIY-YIG nuclease family protein [Nitrospirae bacterium]|nr:GIY-YIG nuclease family protein [Nitrospirota bacterium]
MVSLSNHGSYYTGVTNDIERRFYEHQEGLIEGCYTHDKRPLKLIHVEEFTDIIEAISREKQIKGWSRRKKEAIIAGDYEELVKLPFDKLRVTVFTHRVTKKTAGLE